jgi:hypothetical protein
LLPLIELRGKLTESSSLDGLAAGAASVADAAQDWRGRMGELKISDLTLNWPDAHAELKGDVGLNGAGLPAGHLEGERVQNGKSPTAFGLTLDNGDIHAIATLPASAARPRPERPKWAPAYPVPPR